MEQKITVQYVAGTANEFRIWDANGNFLRRTDETAGHALAKKIERALNGAKKKPQKKA